MNFLKHWDKCLSRDPSILWWARHIMRLEDHALVKLVWNENPDRRRPPGCPKKRRKDQVVVGENKQRGHGG